MIVTQHGLSVFSVLALDEETGWAVVTVREGNFQLLMLRERICDLIADGGIHEIRQALEPRAPLPPAPDLKPRRKKKERRQ